MASQNYNVNVKVNYNGNSVNTGVANLNKKTKAATMSINRMGAALATAFGAGAGLYGLVQFTQNTVRLIKETQRLDFALKAISGTQEEYARSTSFLQKISEDYGLEINGLTRSYNKFMAATKGTSVEGDKAREIFDKISKSTAVMGLSAADAEGVFYALQQMISKGTVSSEELKRQLGDRLPGAFRIMADALDITQGELLKMLETGSLLTEDVLPKFAAEVERAYGADQVDRVETLVAAQNRLTTAWKNFVKEVDNGDGIISGALTETYGAFTDILEVLKEINSQIEISKDEKGYYIGPKNRTIAPGEMPDVIVGGGPSKFRISDEVQEFIDLFYGDNDSKFNLDRAKKEGAFFEGLKPVKDEDLPFDWGLIANEYMRYDIELQKVNAALERDVQEMNEEISKENIGSSIRSAMEYERFLLENEFALFSQMIMIQGSVIADAFSGIFDALEEIAFTRSFGKVFQYFLADMLKQSGSTFIRAGIQNFANAALMDALGFITFGATSIAARQQQAQGVKNIGTGVALGGAGAIYSGFLGRKQAKIEEANKRRQRLPEVESQGLQAQNVIVTGQISGNDLRLVNDRYANTNKRMAG